MPHILKSESFKATGHIVLFTLLVFFLSLSLLPVPVHAADVKAWANSSDVTSLVDREGRQLYKVIVPGKPPKQKAAAVAAPVVRRLGATTVLGNVPAFNWSYGCSATAASMLFGYYDRTGYPVMYTGPANGGVCPLDNSVWGAGIGDSDGECPINATHNGKDGLVTRGHVDDYWIQYGNTDPDPYITNSWTEHTSNCAGDFMGTNQSKYTNHDGSTGFYFYQSGAPLYDYTAAEPGDRDGCHGMKLFTEYRGYAVQTNFSQMIMGAGTNPALGFTFANFCAEIDAGRPVFIQVDGHTMLGYGYDTTGNVVYIHDTWDYNNHTMTWGGTYSGLQHYGVTVIRLAPIATATVTNSTGATNIASTTATLNGEITSTGGENPTVHVCWGDNDGGTNPASWDHDENLGIKGAGSFYRDISSLTPSTPYYYRCYATNSAGPSWASSTASFTTSSAGNWLTGWGYRKQITITGSPNGAQANYQMKLTINRSTGTDSGSTVYVGTKCASDYKDIRFTKTDGTTLLDYWIESATTSTATVWIELDAIPVSPGTANFYFYYGNAGASSLSNGTNTFIFFSDFETTDDFNQWTINQSGSNTVSRQSSVAYSNSYAAYVDHNDNAAVCGLSRQTGFTPGQNIRVRFVARANASDKFLAFYQNDANDKSVSLAFSASSNSKIQYYNGTSWNNIQDFNINTWYDFLFTTNYTAGTFNLWIDGVSKLTGAAMNTEPLANTGPRYYSYFSSLDWYVDRYIASKYTANEPTWTTWGIEESGGGSVVPPTVTNATGASSVTSTAATLNGEITSTGNENPTVHVCWGDNDGGTNPASWDHDENLGIKGAGSFYRDISSLTPSTPYYYRCYATNSAGPSWASSTASFTTSSAGNWLTGWGYRKQITITGSPNGAQANYQMKLTINRSTGTDSGSTVYVGTKCASDYKDIRFTKTDGTTLLDYWIESATTSTATVWIELDAIPVSPGTANFYFYYGNAGASSLSNGTNTFIFFSDFETTDDFNQWTINQSGSNTVSRQSSVAYSNSYAAYVDHNDNAAVCGLSRQTGFTPGQNIRVRFVARANASDKFLAFYQNDANDKSVSLAFSASSNSKIQYYNGTSWNNIQDFNINTWYDFLFTTNYTAGTFNLWIDGVSKLTGAAMNTEPLANTGPRYYSYFSSLDWYVDRYIASKYTANEPTWTTWGIEENAPPPEAPTPPTLLSPGTAVTFKWNASAGATKYRLQVSTSSSFSSTVFDAEVGNVTSYEVTILALGTTYYWHVAAGNDGGWSSYSAVRSVTAALVP